jgi:N-acetylglucosamine-6-phosphate deacetylase
MLLVLDNATLWIGDGSSYAGHVVIDSGKITSVGRGRYPGSAPKTDLGGAALSPGLIDLMVLGGFGKSILRDDPLDIAREYLRLGVTSMQLCIGTLPWEGMIGVAKNADKARSYRGDDAAAILGLYPEGPFQDPNLTGASSREYALPPSPENVRRIIDELGGVVTMINVAPGTPGDAAAVRAFTAAGRRCTMAHSNAPAERVLACVDAGTCALGHVFDNNSGLIGDSGVQQPTIEHVALTDERVRHIHLICDGVHVHPVMIKLVLRCRGVGAVCLVTDGNQRMGTADGPFNWDDGRAMYKKGGVCRTADRDWLAGSATLLPDMFRNFVRFTGLPPHEAITTVTANPAASLGLERKIGVLARGNDADLVAWDAELNITRVWRRGKEVANVSRYAEVAL